MGTVLLQGSGDGRSTYTTLWSKSGDEGGGWCGANVSVKRGEVRWLESRGQRWQGEGVTYFGSSLMIPSIKLGSSMSMAAVSGGSLPSSIGLRNSKAGQNGG